MFPLEQMLHTVPLPALHRGALDALPQCALAVPQREELHHVSGMLMYLYIHLYIYIIIYLYLYICQQDILGAPVHLQPSLFILGRR